MKRNLATAWRIVGALIIIAGLGASASALADDDQSGHMDWEKWSFDWEVENNTAVELQDVVYDKELVLEKASLPVIRVKYDQEWPWWHPYRWFGIGRSGGKCGPFQDRITWNRLRDPVPSCKTLLNRRLCVETFTADGVKWLKLGGYAMIGEYHIYVSWLLSEDGEMRPMIESRGLSCKTNHIHHPYWRLHFSINGSIKEQVFVHNDDSTNEGWGPGWHKYRIETDVKKNPSTHRVWFVRDSGTGHGVWIIPGPNYGGQKDGDGVSDSFSNRDVSIRDYFVEEDLPWLFGADGDLGYNEEQPVQEGDIVFWYVAHLKHPANLGPEHWLAVGPVLKVQR